MHFDLLKIFHEMDWMARLVTAALLVMGIASLAVWIERTLAYGRSRRQSRKFAELAAGLVPDHQYERLVKESGPYVGGHLPRALVPALQVYLAYEHDHRHAPEVIEAVRRELLRQQEQATTDLRKGLSVLASVGSVAPFVGLLGTVVGIIAAFSKISATGSGGLSSVAGGISEALVVTALGLLIAIPAVLVFNALSGQADRLGQNLGVSIGQFIDHIELGGPGTHQRKVRKTQHEANAHVAQLEAAT
jgi:biopolymer transport protein ExbB